MTDDTQPKPKHAFETRLSHAGRAGTHVQGFVNPPVHRGSTVLQPNTAERRALEGRWADQVITYGAGGTPTHTPLENMIAEIEGGTRCQIVSTGLAAITVPLLAFLKAGDHLLLTDSVYGPSRRFANGVLAKFGVTTTYYHPCITPGELRALIRPNTRVLFLESPGSLTFEVQDVPALAQVAHAHGLTVMMDNTWGFHHFQPFEHGVDVSIQALTKYAAGHSDVMLGGITTNTEANWHILRRAALDLGQFASPDDCWLALRGLRTLSVRQERQAANALRVAEWLVTQPEVLEVRHPALPGAPGHEIWKRDFTGAASLFGVVMQPGFSRAQLDAMIDSLELFGLGASWGGFESLATPTADDLSRSVGSDTRGGKSVRLHIGLEAPDDLIADLRHGLDVMHRNTIGEAAAE